MARNDGQKWMSFSITESSWSLFVRSGCEWGRAEAVTVAGAVAGAVVCTVVPARAVTRTYHDVIHIPRQDKNNNISMKVKHQLMTSCRCFLDRSVECSPLQSHAITSHHITSGMSTYAINIYNRRRCSTPWLQVVQYVERILH